MRVLQSHGERELCEAMRNHRLDGEAWTELGSIATPFVARTIEFDPHELRYVRARSTKRTMLHLEALEVR
jgi:hypothetical protein